MSAGTLESSDQNILLSSGEVFSIPPREMMSDDNGYIGSQNQLGVFSTVHGLFTLDSYSGKIFFISEELNEISAEGMKGWFRENLTFWFQKEFPNADIYYDLPFAPNGMGITVAYDQEFNRVLVTKKEYSLKNKFKFTTVSAQDLIAMGSSGMIYFAQNGLIYLYDNGTITPADFDGPDFINGSFTWSYSLDYQKWTCEHDYIPQLYAFVKNYLYGFAESTFWVHNRGPYGKYYDEVTHPFVFDVYVNMEPEASIQLYGVKWTTNIKDVDGNTLNNNTFTHAMVYNDRQCSGIVPLTGSVGYLNKDAVDQSWKFYKFRDMAISEYERILLDDYSVNEENIDPNKPWNKRRRFYGKHQVLRLIYDNQSGHEISLLELTPFARILT